jgi:hypothetical protein
MICASCRTYERRPAPVSLRHARHSDPACTRLTTIQLISRSRPQSRTAGPGTPPGKTTRSSASLNEVQVAQKRGLDGAETVAFVRGELAAALEAFAPLQEEPAASATAPLQDLGTYPLHAIADIFTFDITTHLRYDIVKPRGPIEVNLPRLDERLLGPAVSWLLAGIPRMQPKLPQAFAGPLGLDLTGPARTRVTISSDGTAITVMPSTDSDLEPRAIITSSTDDFLAWSTRRMPWQRLVSVEGDRDEAARFLNALNLI